MGEIIIGALLAWMSGVLSAVAYTNYMELVDERNETRPLNWMNEYVDE
jgi:hypothetical protein